MQVNVYPNPASNIIQVGYTSNIGQISIYDVLGNEVINTKEKEIDISILPNGVYYAQLKTVQGTGIQKVTVQH